MSHVFNMLFQVPSTTHDSIPNSLVFKNKLIQDFSSRYLISIGKHLLHKYSLVKDLFKYFLLHFDCLPFLDIIMLYGFSLLFIVIIRFKLL